MAGQPWTAKNQGMKIMFGGTEAVFMKTQGGESGKIEAKAKTLDSIDSVENGQDFPGHLMPLAYTDGGKYIPLPRWWITTSKDIAYSHVGDSEYITYRNKKFLISSVYNIHDVNATSTFLFAITMESTGVAILYRWSLSAPNSMPTTLLYVGINDWPEGVGLNQYDTALAAINANCTQVKIAYYQTVKTINVNPDGSLGNVTTSAYSGGWESYDTTVSTPLPNAPIAELPASCPTFTVSSVMRQPNHFYGAGSIIHPNPSQPQQYMTAANSGTSYAGNVNFEYTTGSPLTGTPTTTVDGGVTWVYAGDNDTTYVADTEMKTFTAWSGKEWLSGTVEGPLDSKVAEMMGAPTGPVTDGFHTAPGGAQVYSRALSRSADGPSSWVSTYPKSWYSHTPFAYPGFSKTVYGASPAFYRRAEITTTYGVLDTSGDTPTLTGETFDQVEAIYSYRLGKQYNAYPSGTGAATASGVFGYTGKKLLGWVRDPHTGVVNEITQRMISEGYQNYTASGTGRGVLYSISFVGFGAISDTEKELAFAEINHSEGHNYTISGTEMTAVKYGVYIGEDLQFEYQPRRDSNSFSAELLEYTYSSFSWHTLSYLSSVDLTKASVTDYSTSGGGDSDSGWHLEWKSIVSRLVNGNFQARIFYVCGHYNNQLVVEGSDTDWYYAPDDSASVQRERKVYYNGTLIYNESYPVATNARLDIPDPVGYESGSYASYYINIDVSIVPVGKKGQWDYLTYIYDVQGNNTLYMWGKLWGNVAVVNESQYTLLLGSDGTQYSSITLNGIPYTINSSLNDDHVEFMFLGLNSK